MYFLQGLVAKKVRENRKKKFWIFNIIADMDVFVFMWNFLIPKMETRESGIENPRKC